MKGNKQENGMIHRGDYSGWPVKASLRNEHWNWSLMCENEAAQGWGWGAGSRKEMQREEMGQVPVYSLRAEELSLTAYSTSGRKTTRRVMFWRSRWKSVFMDQNMQTSWHSVMFSYASSCWILLNPLLKTFFFHILLSQTLLLSLTRGLRNGLG